MYRGGTVAIAERANTKMEMTEAENFELDIISEFVSIWGLENGINCLNRKIHTIFMACRRIR